MGAVENAPDEQKEVREAEIDRLAKLDNNCREANRR